MTQEGGGQAIKEALEEGNAPHGDTAVTSLRPRYGGRQTATVKISQEAARVLTEQRRIRIGLAPCRVQMRTEVLQC